jgi:hypothetical protein
VRIFPRRTRWARLHTTEDLTYEGILLGRYAGHYVFESCSLLHDPENKSLLRGRIEVPAEKCRMVQVLK